MESSALKFFFVSPCVSLLAGKKKPMFFFTLTDTNAKFSLYSLRSNNPKELFLKKKKKKKKTHTNSPCLICSTKSCENTNLVVSHCDSYLLCKNPFFFSISWCYIQLQESSSCLYAKPLGPKSQNSIRNCL